MDQRQQLSLPASLWAHIAYALSLLWLLDFLKGLPGFVPRLRPAPVIHIRGRSFQLLDQLGEGGYALVHRARELPSPQRPIVEDMEYAIKKLMAPTAEHMALAHRETQIHSSLVHPGILRLLAYDIVNGPGAAAAASASAPVSTAPASAPASAAEEPQPGVPAGNATSAPGPDFMAIDMTAAGAGCGGAPGGAAAYLLLPVFPDGTLAQEVESQQKLNRHLSSLQVLDIFQQVCAALSYMHESKAVAHRDMKPHNILISRPAPQHHQHRQQGSAADGAYQAVVMDFGSAAPRHAPLPGTRREALLLQEEAEAHCTATYRAPELFDVPTGAPLDYAACDAWALGCTLYAAMYGASPFQRAADQPGGSVALAALNCSIPWPKEREHRYPEPMHELVRSCLVQEPGLRPSAGQLAERAGLLKLSLGQAAGV